jgi:hypothetical protein
MKHLKSETLEILGTYVLNTYKTPEKKLENTCVPFAKMQHPDKKHLQHSYENSCIYMQHPDLFLQHPDETLTA